jgi:hypothetical protein
MFYLRTIFKKKECMPQGAILSMTVITVAINGVVNTVGPSVSTSLYVDDVAILHAWRCPLEHF